MRVVVAMSGGVDSAVAAGLLKAAGYEVIGVTMRLFDDRRTDVGWGCCGFSGIEAAKRAAAILGIPFYVFDLRQEFARLVIDDFVAEYRRGRTPNPCIRCNEQIKFQLFRQKAKLLGAEFIATGHHARLQLDQQGRWHLYKGVDLNKDQSYFLYVLTQEQMRFLRLPVGEFTKEMVRQWAREFGLPNAERQESQEICFIPGDDYIGFLRERDPELFQPGPIYDIYGRLLGEHQGIVGFTIGQRRGLGLAFGERRYVVRIDPERNAVIIGPAEAVYQREVEADDVRWPGGRPPADKLRAWAKVRSQGPGSWAEVTVLAPDRVRVVFEKKQWAPTPGQAVVFWGGEEVLGGGTIVSGG